MKRSLLLGFCAAVAMIAVSAPASAASITVTPWLAPNAFGSPSYAGAVSNAIVALHDGLPSYGPAGPTQFNADSSVTASQAIVTGFPSWMGVAGPTGSYAAELGNRMLFGVRIDGSGTQFSISQLSFSATSTNANALGFSLPIGSYNYSADYQGVMKGADNTLFTADDLYVTSGLNTQLVDGLVGRGSGSAFAAYCPGCTVAQQQAAIDLAAADSSAPFQFTGTYVLNGSTGSGTFDVAQTPLPAALPMIASVFGIGGLVTAARRKLKSKKGTAAPDSAMVTA